MGCSDTTNGFLSISQSAPFAPTFSTTLDKNGLVQNNSSGTGFNLQTGQDLTLTCPSANKIIVPNGNDIDLSSTTGSVVHTTTYGKDGMESQDFLAGTYASQANLTQSSGASQMFISSSNLSASSNQYLRCEATAGGNLNIEHNGSSGRNLAISTNQSLSISAPNQPITVSTGSFITNTTGITGSPSQPTFVIDSANATVGSHPAIKLDRSLGNLTAGSALSTISSWGRDASGVSREWTRISSFAQNVATGNQDGRLGIWTSINGATPVEVFNFNGADNENNSFRPIDLNGNVLKSSTLNLTIDATSSSGTGNIIISPKVNTGVSTLRMTGSVVGDEMVVEKNTNFADFFQTGGTGTTNAQMRLGNGGLRMITSSATPPTFGLDNASFATATHQFTGSNYDITLPSTGTFSYTNASTINVKGASVSTSTGDLTLTGTLSSGTGAVDIKTKDAVAGSGTGLILTGNTLLNASAGGNSGQHLCLTINGSVYKIALLNP
jgi:hypothetical protein